MVYSIYGMFRSQAIPKIVNDEPQLNDLDRLVL